MEEQMTRQEKIENLKGMLEQRFRERNELSRLIDDLSSDLNQAIKEKQALQNTIDYLFSQISYEEIQMNKAALEKSGIQ